MLANFYISEALEGNEDGIFKLSVMPEDTQFPCGKLYLDLQKCNTPSIGRLDSDE